MLARETSHVARGHRRRGLKSDAFRLDYKPNRLFVGALTVVQQGHCPGARATRRRTICTIDEQEQFFSNLLLFFECNV
jgi:hypothetical protein